MKCSKCRNPAVYPVLCREHFIASFEERVLCTIKKHHMIQEGDNLSVAVSGGKDSMSLLFLLHRHGFRVSALAINEGIAGYRGHTLSHLRSFCKAKKIPLRVVSFKEAVGRTLDGMMRSGGNPCTVCGKLRRKLLNDHANGFDRLTLGHNLDDEAQTVLMNLFTYKPNLRRVQQPITPKKAGYVQRIKPFCFMKEKEILLYAVLNGISPPFAECPYMHESLRMCVRDALNGYEESHPGAKENIYRKHLDTISAMK